MILHVFVFADSEVLGHYRCLPLKDLFDAHRQKISNDISYYQFLVKNLFNQFNGKNSKNAAPKLGSIKTTVERTIKNHLNLNNLE